MATNAAAVVKGSVKQQHVDAIERRLSLMGGTTLTEIGADLVERFGTTNKKIRDIRNTVAALDDDSQLTVTEKTVQRKSLNEEREATEIERKQEISKFKALALKYVEAEYGDAVINEQTRQTIGYGSRLEVVKGHLKKIW